MLSDLVEEIKIGGFFFINIAVLVNWSIFPKKKFDTSQSPHV